MPRRPGQFNDEEDVADIFANIYHNKQAASVQEQKQATKPAKLSRKDKKDAKRALKATHTPQPLVVAQIEKPKVKKPKMSRKIIKRTFITLTILLIAIVSAYLAKDPVKNLLSSKSPFPESISATSNLKLYYPKELPSGYSIDKKNISNPEPDVVIYAIVNKNGKNITVSQQSQPTSLNLDPLYTTLKDVRTITTPVGAATIGISESKNAVTNILTGSTWIIITQPESAVTSDSFDAMLQSLTAQ